MEQVNYEYIDSLNTFFQTAHDCKNNGAVNLLCCLKNFILFCLRNEWIAKNPFQHYKMKIDKTNVKTILTKAELDILIQKPMPNDRLEKVRDVFAFCCFTGLAFTDADHLRPEHISTDENSVKWIHKHREKTAVMSRVALLPHPIKLLDKYKAIGLENGNRRQTESNRTSSNCRGAKEESAAKLLPVPSNQRMNSYLKEISAICNIDKTLTTHCARHTFTCLAVEYGMPIDVLAKILGHTNTNMPRHYAKFSENLIGKEMMKKGNIFAEPA